MLLLLWLVLLHRTSHFAHALISWFPFDVCVLLHLLELLDDEYFKLPLNSKVSSSLGSLVELY